MVFKKRMPDLRQISLIVLAAACAPVFAAGLGAIQVQSALGQALQVSVLFSGADYTNINELCPKGKVETIDGVLIARPQINLKANAPLPALIITTKQAINEPAVALSVEIGCSTSDRRNYQILLDPVSNLPTVSNTQAASQSAAVAVASQSATQSELVAPPVESTRTDANVNNQNVRAAHKNKSVKHIRAKQNVTEQPKTAGKLAGLTTKLGSRKMSRNVLRLSSVDSPSDSSIMVNGLKLSNSISVQGGEIDPVKAIEIQTAQLRFAALMRDEDPEKNAEMAMKAAQEKIQALKIEADQIKNQSMEDKRLFDEQQSKSIHMYWFFALAAALFVGLIAIGWMAWRLHSINQQYKKPFQDIDLSDDDDDEIYVSPFPDTVIDLSSAPVVNEGDVPVEPQRFHDPENDATFGKIAGGRVHNFTKAGNQQTTSTEKPHDPSIPTLTNPAPVGATIISRYQKRSEMLKVEEVSEAVQEAEFWISLNNPQRAIDVLEQYGDIDHPDSPTPWLYLLELYRSVDERVKYEDLHKRFKLAFNSKVPGWDSDGSELRVQGIDEIPHLAKQICDLWNSNEVVSFLEGLLIDNRKGEREGFDLPVYIDLILLTNLAYELYPSSRFRKLLHAKPKREQENSSIENRAGPFKESL